MDLSKCLEATDLHITCQLSRFLMDKLFASTIVKIIYNINNCSHGERHGHMHIAWLHSYFALQLWPWCSLKLVSLHRWAAALVAAQKMSTQIWANCHPNCPTSSSETCGDMRFLHGGYLMHQKRVAVNSTTNACRTWRMSINESTVSDKRYRSPLEDGGATNLGDELQVQTSKHVTIYQFWALEMSSSCGEFNELPAKLNILGWWHRGITVPMNNLKWLPCWTRVSGEVNE